LRIIPGLPDGTLKHLAILGPGDYAGEPDFSGGGAMALPRGSSRQYIAANSLRRLRSLLTMTSARRSVAEVAPEADVIGDSRLHIPDESSLRFPFPKSSE